MQETLHVKLARLEEQMKTLFKQNEMLTEEVRQLVAIMNRGRGAFGLAMLLASACGALFIKLLGIFLER